MKHALVILTDPQPAAAEAVSRTLNALAFAAECQRCGDELALVFAGAGTRWPAELAQPTHPAHALYDSLREHVLGASRSCALRNNAIEGLQAAGVPFLTDNQIPGTQGVASLRRLHAEGWTVSIF